MLFNLSKKLEINSARLSAMRLPRPKYNPSINKPQRLFIDKGAVDRQEADPLPTAIIAFMLASQMSKNARTSRAKSGSSLRPLGALRLAQGASSQHAAPTRNDPALHINQLNTSNNNSAPPTQLIKEKEREFKIREQKLKDHITTLEKLIAELRSELKIKSEVCDALKKTLEAKIKYYEDELLKLGSQMDNVKERLEVSEAEIKEKQKKIDGLIEDHEKKICDLRDEYEQKIKELEQKRETELKERDDKLAILKQRMAETIGKKSSERQQQLEELKKDLIKASQEARELHKKLKYIQMNPPKCSNCATLESQLNEKRLQVRLKDKTINDLQNIGKSMQLQLTQQDMILTKWEEREKRD